LCFLMLSEWSWDSGVNPAGSWGQDHQLFPFSPAPGSHNGAFGGPGLRV